MGVLCLHHWPSKARFAAATPAQRRQPAILARAGGPSLLNGADRTDRLHLRSPSPELIQLPARNSDTAAVGSSIKYRIKPNKGHPSHENPVADFMTKLKLAWDIFFPEPPQDVTPKEEGKQRLRMILVADRCGMTPSGLTEMKKNILHAIEEFVDIDVDSEEQINVNITTEPDVGTVYSVAVPIRRVKPEARLSLNQEGEVEDLTFEWDNEDFDADPAARFPYGT